MARRPASPVNEDKILLTRTGWALGLGAEVAIAPDWTGRLEYPRSSFAAAPTTWTMDQPGYTWGALAELNQKFWAFRAGYFLVPVLSNIDDFDTHFPDGEYISELELRYSLFSQPGKLRLMAWANRADMGSYAEALAEPITTPNYPDITSRAHFAWLVL